MYFSRVQISKMGGWGARGTEEAKNVDFAEDVVVVSSG